MPVKISSDMPLPMPRSVICSPSHMMNAVPAVSVITHSGRNSPLVIVTIVSPVAVLVSVRPMKKLCTTASRTVT